MVDLAGPGAIRRHRAGVRP